MYSQKLTLKLKLVIKGYLVPFTWRYRHQQDPISARNCIVCIFMLYFYSRLLKGKILIFFLMTHPALVLSLSNEIMSISPSIMYMSLPLCRVSCLCSFHTSFEEKIIVDVLKSLQIQLYDRNVFQRHVLINQSSLVLKCLASLILIKNTVLSLYTDGAFQSVKLPDSSWCLSDKFSM